MEEAKDECRLKERLFSYFNLGRTGASSINRYMSSGFFS